MFMRMEQKAYVRAGVDIDSDNKGWQLKPDYADTKEELKKLADPVQK